MTVTSTCAGAADTVFVRDSQTVIAEYAASTAAASTLRKYVNASYVDEPVLLIDRTAAGSVGAGTDERFYFHRNQQYSITALTDNSGTVVERYAYTAYGEPTILDGAGTTVRTASFIANPNLYTARAYDAESVLYYFRARMYEGRQGRFLSHDPIMYPDGANTYAGWFSLSTIDPMGLAEGEGWEVGWMEGHGFYHAITVSYTTMREDCGNGNYKSVTQGKVTGEVGFGLGATVKLGRFGIYGGYIKLAHAFVDFGFRCETPCGCPPPESKCCGFCASIGLRVPLIPHPAFPTGGGLALLGWGVSVSGYWQADLRICAYQHGRGCPHPGLSIAGCGSYSASISLTSWFKTATSSTSGSYCLGGGTGGWISGEGEGVAW